MALHLQPVADLPDAVPLRTVCRRGYSAMRSGETVQVCDCSLSGTCRAAVIERDGEKPASPSAVTGLRGVREGVAHPSNMQERT